MFCEVYDTTKPRDNRKCIALLHVIHGLAFVDAWLLIACDVDLCVIMSIQISTIIHKLVLQLSLHASLTFLCVNNNRI